MEGAGYTSILFFERLNCYIYGENYSKLQNIWIYCLIIFIYGLCSSILTFSFCSVLLPDQIIPVYWIGNTTIAAIGLLIICWKNYKKLQIERCLKSNLNKRYILIEEHASIMVYITIVMIHCICSYISFLLYIFQKHHLIKRGFVRVIIDLFFSIFSSIFFLSTNLVKPTMRRKIKHFLQKFHIIKETFPITSLQTKNERKNIERDEHYKQLRKMW